jgi:hypothetical protein
LEPPSHDKLCENARKLDPPSPKATIKSVMIVRLGHGSARFHTAFEQFQSKQRNPVQMKRTRALK